MKDTLTYDAFLEWHQGATSRLQDGEWIADPSEKFFQHWRKVQAEQIATEKAAESLPD